MPCPLCLGNVFGIHVLRANVDDDDDLKFIRI